MRGEQHEGGSVMAADGDAGQPPPIQVRLDDLLAERGMTLAALSERVGITVVNLSILKNGRARAVRFSTLARLCQALHCQPGDLFSYQERPAVSPPGPVVSPPGPVVSPPAPARGRRAAEG
jgi:putative transcriptional regulator